MHRKGGSSSTVAIQLDASQGGIKLELFINIQFSNCFFWVLILFTIFFMYNIYKKYADSRNDIYYIK